MVFKNKKGIELSINFIVMLILGIAMFAGGLVFASKFFKQAEKVRGNLDSQTEKQIEKLLDSGSPVVIPINSKEIFRKQFGTFGVGVLAKYTGKYTLSVKFDDAFKKDKTRITASADSWLQVPTTDLELKKNEKGKFLVGVSVPTGVDSGTYIFEVSVGFKITASSPSDAVDMTQYDNPLQIIVKVP